MKKFAELWFGTGVFAIIAFVGSVAMVAYVHYNTKDKNQVASMRGLACTLWWLSLVSMWLIWFGFYCFQLHPLLIPTYEYPFSPEGH